MELMFRPVAARPHTWSPPPASVMYLDWTGPRDQPARRYIAIAVGPPGIPHRKVAIPSQENMFYFYLLLLLILIYYDVPFLIECVPISMMAIPMATKSAASPPRLFLSQSLNLLSALPSSEKSVRFAPVLRNPTVKT